MGRCPWPGSTCAATYSGRVITQSHPARKMWISSPTQPFADLLNKVASDGYAKWEVNVPQKIFGKSFAPFGLAEGRNFMEYDLLYISRDLLFWGARNIDGRGFDKEENRPTNLQIPLARKAQ